MLFHSFAHLFHKCFLSTQSFLGPHRWTERVLALWVLTLQCEQTNQLATTKSYAEQLGAFSISSGAWADPKLTLGWEEKASQKRCDLNRVLKDGEGIPGGGNGIGPEVRPGPSEELQLRVGLRWGCDS